MTYLGMADDELRERGGYRAALEIERQPRLWHETYQAVCENRGVVRSFFAPLIGRDDVDALFVGAGSSGLASECALEHARRYSGLKHIRCVRSTELILRPEAHLMRAATTVLVLFGSSGSTPEVVESVRLAKLLCKDLYLVIINCTDDGVVVRGNAGDPKALYIPLPQETKGESFAATAEFTCLVFQAMLLFDIEHLDAYGALFPYLEREAERFFAARFANDVAARDTLATTSVGSLEMQVLAAESALKAVEFSGGRHFGNFNSSLEFRHGPKLIMNSPVLALFFIHPDEGISRYDLDMMSEEVTDGNQGVVACLTYRDLRERDAVPPHLHRFEPSPVYLHAPVAALFLYALAMQSIAMLTALKYGVRADWPTTDELVPKVANRVTIYSKEEGR